MADPTDLPDNQRLPGAFTRKMAERLSDLTGLPWSAFTPPPLSEEEKRRNQLAYEAEEKRHENCCENCHAWREHVCD